MDELNHQLELSDYEVANLLQAILFVRSVGGDTGDWHGQLFRKLNQLPIETLPNKTSLQQQRELALRIGWKSLYG